jgi:hypothetical protein
LTINLFPKIKIAVGVPSFSSFLKEEYPDLRRGEVVI